ncbi:MAG: zinc ribbon domain-containing protein [Lachnospiraceae bacterium]|nr:zinc ribbon domain-containing protein [Lachnospiraceae bacterium]
MFCTKCGNQVPDGSAVCPVCGAQLAAPQAAPQAAPVSPVAKAKAAGGKLNKKMLTIIGCAAAAVVVIIALILLLSGGPESVVKKYMKLQEELDEAQEVKNKKLNGDINDIKEDINDLTYKSKKAQKALKLLKDDEEKEADIKWEIDESETYDDDDAVFKGMKNLLEAAKATTKSFKKMAIVSVKVYDKNDKDKKQYLYFVVLKIDGNWYLYNEDPMSGKSIQDVANQFKSGSDKD